MNRLMTAGQDRAWRREAISRAKLPAGGRMLDLGAGTGDLALEALRQQPDSRTFAADFTLEMMRVGKRRKNANFIEWLAADALSLPYRDESFDAVVSGYLLRNVSDIRQALGEQLRVLKPGGRVVALDTTRPQPGPLSPIINLHLRRVIPTLGRLVTSDSDAYSYLTSSTADFLSAEQLSERFIMAGFREVGFLRMMAGTIAIHWGVKR
jgi:demethylmenaquinone methyltransferase/2-methoxy-6-polyprenyl-1,4-benzoquinol methylase